MLGFLKCSSGPDRATQDPYAAPAVPFSVPEASVCGLTGTEDSSDTLLQVTPLLVVKPVNLSASSPLAQTASGSVPFYRI